MRAFHNDTKIKEKYLARVRDHAAADEIIKKRYWELGRGCAVGCTIHSDDHGAYESELGIPRVLAHLEDGLFERLPLALAKTWPLRFLSAIKVGADLSKVWPLFAVYLLTDESQCASRHPSCTLVAEAYEESSASTNWSEVRAAASDAAASASAYSAAHSADASAYSAANASADSAADSAAYARASSADDAFVAAKAAAIAAQAEKLLELLEQAE